MRQNAVCARCGFPLQNFKMLSRKKRLVPEVTVVVTNVYILDYDYEMCKTSVPENARYVDNLGYCYKVMDGIYQPWNEAGKFCGPNGFLAVVKNRKILEELHAKLKNVAQVVDLFVA